MISVVAQAITANARFAAVLRLGRAAAIGCAVLNSNTVWGQSLTVLPVIMQMAPGQQAATLTVINESDAETSVQVRPYLWAQPEGNDQLSPTDELLVSPPLATIAPHARQVVRLVLRRPAAGRETAYRILLDQIPPPASNGMVRITLRLSIPIFAEPANRVAAHLQWRGETKGGQVFLVGVNSGTRHETVRNILLHSRDGAAMQVEPNLSPYVLPGATRRWRILMQGAGVVPAGPLRLTAAADATAIDLSVPVDAAR